MKKIFTIIGVSAAMFSFAQNKILNSGFENWTDDKPDGWFTSGLTFVESTNPVHTGSKAIGVTSKNGSNGNPTTSNLGATDATEIVAGKTYTYEGWYLDNVDNARFRPWGQWRTASALLESETSLQGDYAEGGSAEWKKFSIEAVAPATAVIARLSLRVYHQDNNVGGTIYFDDIIFGEKGTMAVTNVNDFDKQVVMNTLVKDALTLRLPARSTVNIYSMDGKLVSSNRVDNGGSINTQSLVKGTYLVTVDNGSAKVSRKVVKQ